jgi:ferritin-like metal-binding protein YciE
MQIKNFKDMYTELQELVSMESQIDIALKRMADALR